MLQRKFSTLFYFCIILLSIYIEMKMYQYNQYDESSVNAPVNHSDLYNAMIYPFTRWLSMVLFGIKVKLQILIYYNILFLILLYIGEANAGNPIHMLVNFQK